MTGFEASDAYDPATLASRVLLAGLPYDDAVRLVVEHNPQWKPSRMIGFLDKDLTTRKRLYTFNPWTRLYDRAFVFLVSPETEQRANGMMLATIGALVAILLGLAAIGQIAMCGVVLAATAVFVAVLRLIVWRRRSLNLRYSDDFWCEECS